MGQHMIDISHEIWDEKYRFKTERKGFKNDETVEDTWKRIAEHCSDATNIHNYDKFYYALEDFKFTTAGRILSGIGTDRNVTLFNCYVMGTVPDSLDGIFDMLKEAALTMQQGGGIGYDFSTLRPKGAFVKGVESFSSGPISFMDVWNSMCKTIMSAGHRRGAMMATMRCDHPDIIEFITAKQDATRLRHFNLSVLVTDKFMEAVKNDENWELIFDNKVYNIVKAKALWNTILENTYNYAEPGVIFIDRINKNNNLHFLETIAATNPCGEQPLPPYGACLLGSINLTKFVENPFTEESNINFDKLNKVVEAAVEMLDCINDISNFPLKAQEEEAQYKRRQGLGITGLADMFFMLGVKYGSKESANIAEQVIRAITIHAYYTSVQLAKEYGPAPFAENYKNRLHFIDSGFMKNMPESLKKYILEHGIRNSHLISIAPTGTISMYMNNVSSGCEPIFATSFKRQITNPDGTKRTREVKDYAVSLYENELLLANKNEDPDQIQYLEKWWDNYMVTAQDLAPNDHIVIQAALQKYVDSSISKTVNCPVDISFEDFKEVYQQAYDLGCKGCTTYRPNDITGSILSVKTDKPKEEKTKSYNNDMRIAKRPDDLFGKTYKIKWNGDAYYVTINDLILEDNSTEIPFEIFINSKNVDHQAWIAGLTRTISAIFQRGGDITFIAKELKNIHDPKGGAWVDSKYRPSLLSYIGDIILEHIQDDSTTTDNNIDSNNNYLNSPCPSCQEYTLIVQNGCPTCHSCGYSKCG